MKVLAWKPIDTAPRAWAYDVTAAGERYCGGDVIKVRGTHKGEIAEFFVHWSRIGDGPEHWFIYETEPLNWPADEWRHLTEEESLELFGESEPA